MGRDRAVSRDQAGVPSVWHQPDLLPVQGQVGRRERPHRGLAGATDEQPAQLRFRAVFPIPAQREGLQMEPQARLQDLPRARTEPADQAASSARAREASAAGGADRDQPELVDGLHARSTG